MAGGVNFFRDPEAVAERERRQAEWQANVDRQNVENEQAGPRDKLGNPVAIPDVVAYGANAGQQAGRLRISWVKKLEFKQPHRVGAWWALVTRPNGGENTGNVSTWQRVDDTLKLPHLAIEDVKPDDTRYY